MKISLIVLSLLLFSQTTFAGKIYRWVDDEGNTHFTQSPPANYKAKKLNLRIPKINSQAAKDNLSKKIEGFQTRRDEDKIRQTEGEEGVVYKRKLDKYCSALKANLATLKNSKQVTEKGSDKVISGEAKQKKVQAVQNKINEKC